MAFARKLAKEVYLLQTTGLDGIQLQSEADDLTRLSAWIDGPADTPYAGGRFKVNLSFGPDYPQGPPHCTFSTRIFHPNVNERGEICVNTLKKDWHPDFGIKHILTTIRCLLIYPNPESALHEEAGRLLLEDYEEYASRARLMTSIHAASQQSIDSKAESPATHAPESLPFQPTSNINRSKPKLANGIESGQSSQNNSLAGQTNKKRGLRRL